MFNSISDAADTLARIASTTLTLCGGKLDADKALDLAARSALANASDAKSRGGIWATESTSEQIEEALFFGAVASDVLDGTVSRPRIGNVRSYALSRVSR